MKKNLEPHIRTSALLRIVHPFSYAGEIPALQQPSLRYIPCLRKKRSAGRRRKTDQLILITILSLTGLLYNAPNVHAQSCANTTGLTYGSSFSTAALSGSVFNWTNPTKAMSTTDGGVASASLTLSVLNPGGHSNYLTAEGFGFSIPTGAKICGITVEVVRYATGISVLSNVNDYSVQLLNNGTPTGSNLASGSNWSGSSQTVTYGGSGSLWGSTWAASDINNSQFGVAISASVNGLLGVALTANIDQIRVNITYDMSILPLTLENYSVTRAPDGNQLTWTASSSLSGTRFTVQRGPDAHGWLDISSIGGPDAVSSANKSWMNYSYTDYTPPAGNNFYRLKMENIDGTTTYSTVAEVTNNNTTGKPTCYPNPFTDCINISSPHPLHRIQLKDLQGRTLQTKEFADPVYNTQLTVPDLPPGIYLLQTDTDIIRVMKKTK